MDEFAVAAATRLAIEIGGFAPPPDFAGPSAQACAAIVQIAFGSSMRSTMLSLT
jgi:hypothetical protein